jgi:hypothetical protein
VPLPLFCATLPRQTKRDRRRSRGPLQLARPLLFGSAKQTKRGRRHPRPRPTLAVGWQQQLLPPSPSGGGTGARGHPHVCGTTAATAQLLPRTPDDVQDQLGRWWGSRRRVRYSGASEGREKEATGRNWRTEGRHARGSEGDRDRANDEWVPPVGTDEKRGRSNPCFNIRYSHEYICPYRCTDY